MGSSHSAGLRFAESMELLFRRHLCNCTGGFRHLKLRNRKTKVKILKIHRKLWGWKIVAFATPKVDPWSYLRLNLYLASNFVATSYSSRSSAWILNLLNFSNFVSMILKQHWIFWEIINKYRFFPQSVLVDTLESDSSQRRYAYLCNKRNQTPRAQTLSETKIWVLFFESTNESSPKYTTP